MIYRFSSIQIIRAIAALSVVMFHSHFSVSAFSDEYKIVVPFVYQWGYLGVDLFFVVSGFIIAHIVGRGQFNIMPFFLRRFFRIYPIYWIFCALAVWLYFTSGYNLGVDSLSRVDAVKAFAIFPQEQHPAYAVGWTLEHEVVFYVLTAIVLSIANIKVLIYLLALLGGVGMFLPFFFASGMVQKFWDYHIFSATNINFMVGILIYLNSDKFLRLKVIFPLVAFVVTLFIWISLLGVIPPIWSGLMTTLGGSMSSALLIIGFLNGEKLYSHRENGFLSGRVSRFFIQLGNASFSLYLVHWIITIESGRMKWKAFFGLPDWSVEFYRFGVEIFSVAVALLIFNFLEVPLTALGHRIARRFEKLQSGSNLHAD